MNGGNNILPTMSTYGREMDHHHYNGVPSSGNSNMLTGYPILYQNNHHNHPAGDLLTLQMQLQGNPSNNENENTLAALQRNWIALQQNNGNVGGTGTGTNNGMLHSSIHHPSAMTLQNDDMGYMRNLIPIGGSNSSPLHSNQSTLLDSLKFGGGLEPPQVSQYGHHHHLANGNLQPSILDNGILGNNVGIPGMCRNNPMNVGTSPNGRLQMQMNPNNGLGVNVDMVPNNGMLPMNCNNSIGGNVIVNTNPNNNIEWQGGIPIRNIPDLMTMLDLSDIPPHVQIPKYYEGIKISLGEAGREILRCYINQRGIRGKFMSSSNLQQLLRVAHQCGLWNAAVRLHLEFIGEIPMTASHAEMRKYKSLQTKRRLSKRISVLSKFGAPVVRRADGEETIEYRDGMKLSLGVDGRKLLLKRIRETRSSRENEINNLFSKYGLKYSQLRNATIHELCRMAYVCGLWEEAVKLHFQHIRKKAHENTSNQQESGSDLDSEMDLNKDRGDDEMISNNFLQQLHTPGIDILNVNGASNPGGMAGGNAGGISQNPVMGAMGADPVHVGNSAPQNAAHHVHQHPSIHPVSHIQSGLGRFGMSSVGGSVPNGPGNKSGSEGGNANSNVNTNRGISGANSMIGIVDNNGGIHPSIVLSNNGGSTGNNADAHALTGDHLNYDDYRNYILDGGNNAGNIDNTGLSSMRSGAMTNISSRIIRHDARGGNMGASSNGMDKVLGSNPNAVNGTGGNSAGNGVKSVGGNNPDVDNLNRNNILTGIENDGLIGMSSTGALGAFVGSSSTGTRSGLSNYDSIGVPTTSSTGYDDYSLLSASLRKRGKVNNMVSGLGGVDDSNSSDLTAHNIVSHPNTSSFVMETISGILGDEPLGNNNIGDKVNNYKGNNLSSVLGNDIGISQNNEVPQLSAVVVLAAAKAAEAAQGYDNNNNDNVKELYEESENTSNQRLEAVDSMLKSHHSASNSPVLSRDGEKNELSSVTVSKPLENNEGLNKDLSVAAECEEMTSYQKDYSNNNNSNGNGNVNGIEIPLESNMLLNNHHNNHLLMDTVNSKMVSSGICINAKYELIGNEINIGHTNNSNDDGIISTEGVGGGVVSTSSATVTSSTSLEVSDPFCYPTPIALSSASNHIEKNEINDGRSNGDPIINNSIDNSTSNTGNTSNTEGGVSLVSRGLTTQSTTDTSIETPGN
ncbi:Uncharacterized protein GY17_00003178 [Cryptosporidium hominis]|uniref:Uncharacterized protein n=1 Tax=Cryptosporidium hominis TaxID=237895 RepID=A0ABX5BAN4_CRYHO|nr:Uncharacterized protein GY17_00003178 [Cryptosporidium hominis]|eukprot:PPS93094.1 Uncharacterized protein GY17_00003178 [Cryptosporidium hominis]